MELRAVVVLGLDVVEEVRDRLRRGVGEELDLDLAGGRVELDLRIGGKRGSAESANAAASAAAAIRNGRRNIDELLVGWKGCGKSGYDFGFAGAALASRSRTSTSFAGAVLLARSSFAARVYWTAARRA